MKENVFVLDCDSEIYVWAGKNASADDREFGVAFATERAESKKGVLFLELDTFERTIFKLKYDNWPTGREMETYAVMEVKQVGNIKAKEKEWKVYDRGSDAKKVEKVDIERMYDKSNSLDDSVAKNTESTEADPAELIRRDWGWANLRIWGFKNMTDSGKRKVIDITKEEFDSLEINYSKEKPFVFYSDECYIFLYDFKERPPKMADPVIAERTKMTKEELWKQMKQVSVMYIWIGSESNISDQAVMAHMALEVEKHARGESGSFSKAKQLRILEGKEPDHFLNMIVGGSSHRYLPQKVQEMLTKSDRAPSPYVIIRNRASEEKSLFRVLGISPENIRVSQLPEVNSSLLCSGSPFVLQANGKAYIWNGIGSFKWEMDAARIFVSEVLKVHFEECSEEQNNEVFFQSLGDNKQNSDDSNEDWKIRSNLPVFSHVENGVPLNSTAAISKINPYDVRLWKISYFINGNPTATEIYPFTSRDLNEENVFILDSYFKLYVWIGANVARTKTNKEAYEANTGMIASGFKEVFLALKTARDYAQFVNKICNRLQERKCVVVQQGKEPQCFKFQFLKWKQNSKEISSWESGLTVTEALKIIETKKYSLGDLRNWAVDKTAIPFGVDPQNLQSHLTDIDFKNVFDMEKSKFEELPEWKKLDLKKRQQLF
jgi:hypothetical protein